jgi:hypothetical protein
LPLEVNARRSKAGIWRQEMQIFNANDPTLVEAADEFRIVTGTVTSVGQTKSRTYLNFSDNWSLDFTASIRKRDMGNFKTAGMDLKYLSGKTVRVRGWMDVWRGPHMGLSHPEQIEVIREDR